MRVMRLLSLGAGIQSSTLALMSTDGTLPPLDGAIFADTGWEPPHVYAALDALTRHLGDADVPVYRVSFGDLRASSIEKPNRSPSGFAWIPYYTRTDRPGRPPRLGMGQRRCTQNFKLRPIERKVRELLGADPPHHRRVRKGNVAEMWIGFSIDEMMRVSDRQDLRYLTKRYPLLDLGLSRQDCVTYLRDRGWNAVAKSACIGCPYHGDAQWLSMRENRPREWADAVAFDEAIRAGGAHLLPVGTTAYLHRSCLPLALAPVSELREPGDPDGCAPYGCRSGAAVT